MRPRAARDAAAAVINVTYVADEGPRIYIERINIIGNLRTRDYVIRREFRLAEGDAYNPLMVDKAKKRLQVLGFFKTVEIKRRPGSAPDRVILEVEVVEQSTGELSFGAGYSTSEGVIGDITITERNLLGRGQFLRLRLAGSQERMQIDLSFTEPRFLDRNLAAGFDLFHKITTVSTYQQFNARTTGGSVRLGFPIAENLWLTNSYTLSNNEISDVQPAASRAIKEAAGEYWTSAVGTGLSYDARNHPKTPTSGYFLTAGTEFAGVGGDVQYVRLQRRRALLLSGDREDHLRRARDRRPHPGLGRAGRPPAGPLLQGWRDDPRLLHVGVRPARHADERCAWRQYVLGGHRRVTVPLPSNTNRTK